MGFRFNISKRIGTGYFIILLIVSITSIASLLQLITSKKKYNEISNVYLPVVSYLKELDALNKEANKLIVDWVRLANKNEKERLMIIQSQDYPILKAKLENFTERAGNADLQKKVASLISEFNTSIVFQKGIMKKLETPENYNNDTLVDAAFSILDNEITPHFNESQNHMTLVLADETNILNTLEDQLTHSFRYFAYTMILILAIIIVVGTIASYLATRSIAVPIMKLKETISSLGKGEIPDVALSNRDDEIGEMTDAILAMIESIKLKTEFAAKTGDGNYSAEFSLLSNKDVLGNALIHMRDNLKQTAEDDAARNWINAGLTQANDLLRINREDGSTFYSDIIVFLSEYLKAGFGSLYVFNDNNKDDVYLELKGTYAFDNNSEKKEKIALGAGLTGQAAKEKRLIFLKDIPENYIKIVSALGETLPKNIVIAPLVFENEIKGIVELATIGDFTDLQIEFLEKISRNIAITFDLVARKANTEMLLSESRQLNEKLKLSQEKLTNANEELSTFVYKSSHDLKGPLATMLGLINLALNENEKEFDVQIIEAIGETANKLDSILNVLIKTMSIREAKVKLEHVNFTTTIQDALLKLKDTDHMTRMRVITNIENKKQFKSDNEIVGYVLQNILENTIKFQNFSNQESFVIIDVNDHEDGVKINVSDNGIGINRNMRNKVFDMFFRGSATSNGYGLGLYFVKNAINKLDGRIELASEEGVGTVVSIFLPSLS